MVLGLRCKGSISKSNRRDQLQAHYGQEDAPWEEKFETVATWFKAGEPVEALLRPFKTRKRRIEAVLEQLLPARRIFWAERCASMAATLKEAAPEEDNTWSEFALVARDLGGKKPLETIPLAGRIAGPTVEAFEQS